jgi:hypothetical protein
MASSYHLSYTPDLLFALVIFHVESHFFLELALDSNPPTSTSCVAGITETTYYIQIECPFLTKDEFSLKR